MILRKRGLNVYRPDGDICLVDVYGIHKTYKGTVIIDSVNQHKCESIQWYIKFRKGKAMCVCGHVDKENRNIRMHRYLFGLPQHGLEYDHINRNPLDNREANLRICSLVENQWNRGLTKANTSGFKGVIKERNRWVAQVSTGNMCHRFGVYDSKEEAAVAYNNAVINIRGEFAYINNIGGA